MNNYKIKTKSRGFSLTETIIAIAIFSLIASVTVTFVLMAYQTYGYTWRQSTVIQEARRGVEVMIKEIREARAGEDGSYAIELAGDKEFIFFSDIDNDGQTERVRYFFGTVSSGNQTKNCVTFAKGGSCSVSFSNFLQGDLKTAQVKVAVEGDLGAGNEYAEIFADGTKLANLGQGASTDCAGAWQDATFFDVASRASDNLIQFIADATSSVDPTCDWIETNHALKAQFELSWTEEIIGGDGQLKKGVIEPASGPGGKIDYPLDQENVSVLSSYIRNVPPIFEYFDASGAKILDYPTRLADTKVMEVYLVVNVDPNRPPQDFELESSVQLRNLKAE